MTVNLSSSMSEPNFLTTISSSKNQPPVTDQAREKLREQLKQELFAKMARVQATARVQDIIDLLGAERFAIRDRHGDVAGLRLTEFVNAEIEEQLTEQQKPFALPERVIHLPFPILPTSGEGGIETGSGRGIAEKKLFPRTRRLMELFQEMNLRYVVLEGTTQPNTMRKENYRMFALPEIHVAISVNDEEGNSTFIIHDLDEADWEEFAGLKKNQLKSTASHPVSVITRPSRPDETGELWKERMRDILTYGPEIKNHAAVFASLAEIPEGWIGLNQLAKDLGTDSKSVEASAEKYRETNPEWFRIALNPRQRMKQRIIAPELATIIREKYKELANLEEVPEGWLGLSELADLIGIDRTSLESTVNKYQPTNPEWFRIALRKGKRIKKLVVAPELIAIVRKKYEEREAVPEGWKTINTLRQETGAAFNRIDRLAEEYRPAHPEWFREYTGKGRRPRIHLAPELVKIIAETIAAQKNIPDGWVHFGNVTKQLGIFHPEAYQLAEPYRTTHPEWFGFFSNQRKAIEYISPELFSAIKKDYESISIPPDGWLNAGEFFKSFAIKKNYGKLDELVARYRVTHPEWIRRFRGRNIGMKLDHFSPELVALLKQDFTPVVKQ